MNRSHPPTLLVAALLACMGLAHAAAPSPSVDAPAATGSQPDAEASNQRTLEAMDAASTWGHPDLWGEFAGMRRYAKGEYKSAVKYFKYGARFADKPSQLALGVMYANGLGVEKDPVTGCAWLTLAAERKYPRFVATRDKFCGELTPAQHGHVAAVLDKLRPEYGDQAAKQRMATTLRVAKTQRTGSRVGFDFGVQSHGGSAGTASNLAQLASSAGSACNSSITVDGIPWPTEGCVGRDFWSPDRWNPKTYFALRDAHWRGTVTVGAMQQAGQPASGTNAKHPAGASQPAQPAPASSAGH